MISDESRGFGGKIFRSFSLPLPVLLKQFVEAEGEVWRGSQEQRAAGRRKS